MNTRHKFSLSWIVLILLEFSPISLFAQVGEDHGAEVFGSTFVYSYIQNSIPLSFCNHQVDYETLYQDNILSPVHFDCKVVGPQKLKPFKRALVIPEDIRVGIHRFIPIEMCSGAFQQTGVKSVDVRAGLRTIPQSAFMFCDELESVEFHGNSPHFIEGNAFRSCVKLKTVIGLPAQLQYVGEQAFYQCLSLESFHFPKDVAFIGDDAFNGCNALRNVTFDSGHFRIIPTNCFRDCQSLCDIVIPEGVEALRENSFHYSGLKSITLPTTMRGLYDGCLSNTPLEEIWFRSNTPPGVGKVFTGRMINSIVLHVPADALDAYRSDRFWSLFPNILPY